MNRPTDTLIVILIGILGAIGVLSVAEIWGDTTPQEYEQIVFEGQR